MIGFKPTSFRSKCYDVDFLKIPGYPKPETLEMVISNNTQQYGTLMKMRNCKRISGRLGTHKKAVMQRTDHETGSAFDEWMTNEVDL